MQDKKIDIRVILEKAGNNPALVWSGGELNYLQYFRKIDIVSETLSQKGVKSGDVIAVLSDINHHFPVIFFSIINLGAIVLPLNPKFPDKKINKILVEFDCDHLISINSSYLVDPDIHVRVIRNIFNVEPLFDGKNSKNSLAPFLDQNSTIILTSGSGGGPKGVLHSIGNHYYSALGSNENIPLSANDCWMVSLPFFHIAGIAILFRTLLSGAACYLPDQTKSLQRQLDHTEVTHVSLVSTQLYRWLNEFQKSESTQSLKAVLLGGSQIPGTLIERALQKDLPLYTSYGSTEMSSQATTTTIGDLKLNSESSGKLLQDRELKIDSDGEILVKGKTLGKGYISGKGVLPFTDSNGWFHTGDLGSLDDNQNLIVTGRKDNMFVSGGENIHPEEIEQQLLFYKEIIDICVVDIPDVEFGARPVAFVKSEYDEKINENDLKEYLKNKLAPFKIPDRFFSWPEEMNGIKPDRWYLRGLAIDLMR